MYSPLQRRIGIQTWLTMLSALAALFMVSLAAKAGEVDLADLANHKEEWPKEVALIQKLVIPVIVGGKQVGTTELPIGTRLTLLEIVGIQLKVQRGSSTRLIPAGSTDLEQRILLARQKQKDLAPANVPSHEENTVPPPMTSTPTNALPSADNRNQMIDLAALARKARPAVGFIKVQDGSGKDISTGSGFFVTANGKFITNYHVIENAARAEVMVEKGDPRNVTGVLAAEPDHDLVLLATLGLPVPHLRLGHSESVEAGLRIAVIGSPLGLEGTLSEGIVSAVRSAPGIQGSSREKEKWIQITAALSPGSSGSPVLDANCEVIGVATLASFGKAQSLNFAVPSEVAKRLLKSAEGVKQPQPLLAFVRTVVQQRDQQATASWDDGESAYTIDMLQTNFRRLGEEKVVKIKYNLVTGLYDMGKGSFGATLLDASNKRLFVKFDGEGLPYMQRQAQTSGKVAREGKIPPSRVLYGKVFQTLVETRNGAKSSEAALKLVGCRRAESEDGYSW